MPEVATISTLTATNLSATTFTIAPVTETAQIGQVFAQTYGFWISDPLVLPGDPVNSSIIRWKASVPDGATMKVETSINFGASWDLAENGKQIPRLRANDTVTRGVIVRITFTRPTPASARPKVSFLSLQVSCDSSTYEMVPIGHGHVDKVTPKTSISGGSSSGGISGGGVSSHGGGQTGGGTSVSIHVTDPSRWIKLAQWEQPLTIDAGTNYGDVIRIMVSDRLPYTPLFSMASTDRVTTSILVFGTNPGSDPWEDIRATARAIGYEVFFNNVGTLVFQPVPDPRVGEPVWEIDQDAFPIVTEAKQELNDEKIRNYIVAKGESTSTQNPISLAVWDDDPASDTYIGRIGKRVETVPFSQIEDEDQLRAAANAVLLNSLGLSDTVTITCVPNPALEPGDIVRLNLPQPGISGLYMIQSMITPLAANQAQQLVCYRQTQKEVAA